MLQTQWHPAHLLPFPTMFTTGGQWGETWLFRRLLLLLSQVTGLFCQEGHVVGSSRGCEWFDVLQHIWHYIWVSANEKSPSHFPTVVHFFTSQFHCTFISTFTCSDITQSFSMSDCVIFKPLLLYVELLVLQDVKWTAWNSSVCHIPLYWWRPWPCPAPGELCQSGSRRPGRASGPSPPACPCCPPCCECSAAGSTELSKCCWCRWDVPKGLRPHLCEMSKVWGRERVTST